MADQVLRRVDVEVQISARVLPDGSWRTLASCITYATEPDVGQIGRVVGHAAIGLGHSLESTDVDKSVDN